MLPPDGRKNCQQLNNTGIISLWSNGLLTLPLTNKLTMIFVRQEGCPQIIIWIQISIKIQLYLVDWKDKLS